MTFCLKAFHDRPQHNEALASREYSFYDPLETQRTQLDLKVIFPNFRRLYKDVDRNGFQTFGE